ncbi:hypothetical protein C8F04DRAFT_281936 [Mycena alexandri]|uniref:Uncharacterized protein n=1 Tax=Mycena alexandri TaxID=1745969 RepID=A0AAD6T9M7_9AGAR|nr:hypothetical protein C8F04DRAFT_281936 [Mycena alexandri]
MHIPQSRSSPVAGGLGVLTDSKRSNVAWISPLSSDIYPAGPMLAKWASDMVDLPSFKLCKASSTSDSRRDIGPSEPGGCGAPVWPAIIESAGVYQATVTMPEVLAAGGYYLQMEDRSENKMRSPVFTLSPDGATTSEPLAGVEPQAQAPFGPANSPVASPTYMVSPLYPGSPIATSAFSPPSALSQVLPAATFNPNPNVLSAKSAPSPAAFAVPLSAVAAIVLVASALLIKHRRKIAAQRARDSQRPSRASSYKSSASTGSGSEIDHALHVLSRHHGHSRDQKPRLDSFPYPAYAQWNPPAYGHTAPQRDPNPPADPAQRQHPCRDQRPRLPPIATTGSFMSTGSDPPTHAVLANYILPSPPLRTSASTPRCLLPAPQQLHLRDNAGRDNPLGSPPADRHRSERDLYAQVESKLSMYRPRRT